MACFVSAAGRPRPAAVTLITSDKRMFAPRRPGAGSAGRRRPRTGRIILPPRLPAPRVWSLTKNHLGAPQMITRQVSGRAGSRRPTAIVRRQRRMATVCGNSRTLLAAAPLPAPMWARSAHQLPAIGRHVDRLSEDKCALLSTVAPLHRRRAASRQWPSGAAHRRM